VNDYDDLERDHGRESRGTEARDLTTTFEQRDQLADAPASVLEAAERFAQSKRFSLDALLALKPRYYVERSGSVVLVLGFYAPNGRVCGVKYRALSSGKRWAESGSTYPRPMVLGDLGSPDWLVAEGETDAARLHELTAGRCAVLVLPAGAKTFHRSYAGSIPRDATVYLMHDSDRYGEEGACKAARVIGGRTVRVAPPKPAKDWCEWDGDTDALRRLVASKRAEAQSRVRTFAEVLGSYAQSRANEELEPIRLGFASLDADLRGVSAGQGGLSTTSGNASRCQRERQHRHRTAARRPRSPRGRGGRKGPRRTQRRIALDDEKRGSRVPTRAPIPAREG
jgi:hypothetical protein